MSRDIVLGKIIKNINDICDRIPIEKINIMEICGTHTNAIAKIGIKNVLHNRINLISGPGCPVCVTPESYIDAAIELLRSGVIILTFGDLMRVKGTYTNLLGEKSKGRDIRIIYSVYDVIKIAEENKDKKVVFLGVGFETTTPLIATVIKRSQELKLSNLFFLISLKIMSPIIETVLDRTENIHGVICPGNVAVITGESSFKLIYEKFKVPAAICGFEDKDIISGIWFLVNHISKDISSLESYGFENLYKRYVRTEGNEKARELVNRIFNIMPSVWRGIGLIDNSGLVLNTEYEKFDAVKEFNLQKFFEYKDISETVTSTCLCTQVLLGKIQPDKCKLFGTKCTPKEPCGPCMISSEGACSAYYRYR